MSFLLSPFLLFVFRCVFICLGLFYRDAKKEQIGAAMAARQKKREDNIAQRNERRKDKKKGVSKGVSKKKARPGFEGKSFGSRGKANSKGKGGSGGTHGKKGK